MKKNKIILCNIAALIFVTTPTIITSCTNKKNGDQKIGKYGNVYNFLNDRTFFIGIYWIFNTPIGQIPSISGGTTWLFYHVPSDDMYSNNYTYYSLTNLHVGGVINYIINDDNYHIFDPYICLSYQTFDEINDPNVTIDINGLLNDPQQHGSSKIFAIDKIDYTKASVSERTTNYLSLFAQYSTMNGVDETKNRIYKDINVIKLDLNESAKQDPILKERLDRLNTYAENNDNYTISFLKEKEIDTVDNLFSLGYPFYVLDPKDYEPKYIIDESHINAQIIHWLDMPYKFNYSKNQWEVKVNYAQLIFEYYQECLTPSEYGGDIDRLNVLSGENLIYLGGSNLTIVNPLNVTKDFGAGASGSCGLYASDINDESTYKVAGIFWGIIYDNQSVPIAWRPCYQSFSYNWNGENNIIENFFKYDWKTQEPIDEFIGKFPVLY